VRPGNSWDLRSCRQQPGESLWDYIRRFSKQHTKLPNITDSDVIGAFLAGTTCRDLVSKLGRKTPTRASELMDIATKFASGQEAIEAIFQKGKRPQGRQPEDVPEASAQRGTKKKGKKKSQAKRDAADADLVAAAEHRNPQKPPGGANLFDKMLKESCPYHQGPVKHTLEECVMLQRYFHKAGAPAEGGKGHDNDKKEGHKAEEFPEVHDCFMIYGGQVANASARHCKQERREVCSVKVAAPVYLDWSDKPITFDQGDHPNRVPSPGKYPLVVDPIIGHVRLTKVLMDGGSSLNIIYAETLGLLQIDLSAIRADAAPFHEIIPGKRVQPLGQLDLPVCLGTPSNFRKETLTFEVVGFRGTYHAVLGRPCYAKFMVVLNYTYLKLKMSGPNGVITVGSTYQQAYECDVECVEYAEALHFPVSNNVAEYEALVNGLRIAIELGVRRLDARGDSQLFIDQVMKNSHCRDPKMEAYCDEVRRLEDKFYGLELNHVARRYNKTADELAKIASERTTVPPDVFSRDLHQPSVKTNDTLEPEEAPAQPEAPSTADGEALRIEEERNGVPPNRNWQTPYL
jgi:ribonuclease HI